MAQYEDVGASGAPENEIFTGDQTHGIASADHSDMELSSEGLGWTSAFVSRQTEAPCRVSIDGCADPLVAFALDGPVAVSLAFGGRNEARRVPPGSCGIVPSNVGFELALDGMLESLHVYVRQSIVDEVAIDLHDGDPSAVEVSPRLGALDPVLERLGQDMLDIAREAPPASGLYIDHLARAFAARLLRKHSNLRSISPPTRPSCGLSARQMESVSAFVHANLSASLSLADLARGSGLSPGHFSRLFKKTRGITPYQYLLRCRVEHAQRLLSETDVPIAQIGMNCGFAHQVHLTQVFRRFVSLTPAEYRREQKR